MSRVEQSRALEQGKLPCSAPCSTPSSAHDKNVWGKKQEVELAFGFFKSLNLIWISKFWFKALEKWAREGSIKYFIFF